MSKKNKLETRMNNVLNIGIQTREEGEGENKKTVKVLSGYAAVFDSLSENLGGYKEKIAVGAFTNTLKNSKDARCLFGHNTMHVLGRQSANTLNIFEDEKGLYFEVTPDTNITWVNDLIKSIERGDINQCSFGFKIISDGRSRENDAGLPIYILHEVALYEISIVAFPAYTETSVREIQDENHDEIKNKIDLLKRKIGLLKIK